MVAATARRQQGRMGIGGSPECVRDSRRNPPQRGRTTAVANIEDAGLRRGSSGGVVPLVAMVEAAEARTGGQRRALRWPRRHRTLGRRVLGEAEVRPVVVVIGDILREQSLQMSGVEDDRVVEKIAPNGLDPSFRDAVGRSCRVHPMMTLRTNVFASRIGFTRCSGASTTS